MIQAFSPQPSLWDYLTLKLLSFPPRVVAPGKLRSESMFKIRETATEKRLNLLRKQGAITPRLSLMFHASVGCLPSQAQQYCFLIVKIFPFAALLLLSACETAPTKPSADMTTPTYTPVAFDDMPGFAAETWDESLHTAFTKNCARWQKKTGDDALPWQTVCATLPATHNAAALQQWVVQNFAPFAVTAGSNPFGLFTGYYEPQIAAAPAPVGNFQHPIYARPTDLVQVDLGAFRPEWQGEKIWGQLMGAPTSLTLAPYPDRAAIATRFMPASILGFTDDPIGLFVLHIQGSGQLRFADGTITRIGYDGVNGRPYVALGKVLRERGLLEAPINMPKIRAFLATQPPAQLQAWLNENPSYVFFKTNAGEGPVGSFQAPLTPGRALAVDPKSIPLGSLVWLDAAHPDEGQPRLQRLMLAQDTGGAIKGMVRGDVFWGAGEAAAHNAGLMQSQGRYFVLRPQVTSVAPH